MGVKLRIKGSSWVEAEYLKEVLSQSYPHWRFSNCKNVVGQVGNHGSDTFECNFEDTNSIDNGVMQQKRAIKEQYPELIKEGIETFEPEEEFFAWMVKPSYGLHGKVALTLAASCKIDEVLIELKRIQYGDLT